MFQWFTDCCCKKLSDIVLMSFCRLRNLSVGEIPRKRKLMGDIRCPFVILIDVAEYSSLKAIYPFVIIPAERGKCD